MLLYFLEKHSKKNKKDKTLETGGIKKLKQVLADYDPTGPVTLSGSLYSFRDLKPMPIPDKDFVSVHIMKYKNILFYNLYIILSYLAWAMSFCR